MFGVEAFGLMKEGGFFEFFVEPKVAAFFHFHSVVGALVDENFFDCFVLLECFVDGFFEGDDISASVATVGGDNEFGSAVV